MNSRTVTLIDRSPVPRWARRVAWAAFVVTIPSAVWRVSMIVGLVPGTAELREFELEGNAAVGYVYVFGLSVVQLGAAFLTVGLIRPWGQVIGGRRVPRVPVMAAGTLGGLAVTWLFTVSMVEQVLTGHRPDGGHVHGIALALMIACYVPIVFWGPLELVSTYAFWRRGRTVDVSGAQSRA